MENPENIKQTNSYIGDNYPICRNRTFRRFFCRRYWCRRFNRLGLMFRYRRGRNK